MDFEEFLDRSAEEESAHEEWELEKNALREAVEQFGYSIPPILSGEDQYEIVMNEVRNIAHEEDVDTEEGMAAAKRKLDNFTYRLERQQEEAQEAEQTLLILTLNSLDLKHEGEAMDEESFAGFADQRKLDLLGNLKVHVKNPIWVDFVNTQFPGREFLTEEIEDKAVEMVPGIMRRLEEERQEMQRCADMVVELLGDDAQAVDSDDIADVVKRLAFFNMRKRLGLKVSVADFQDSTRASLMSIGHFTPEWARVVAALGEEEQ